MTASRISSPGADAHVSEGPTFVSQPALDRARARLEYDAAGPGLHDPVLDALRLSATRVAARHPGAFPQGPTSSNLFRIQTSLFELALSVQLDRSEVSREALSELILALDGDGTDESALPTEVHAAFVLVGLAVGLELAAELLEVETVSAGYDAVARLALRLSDGAEHEPWAEKTANRAAWNHSMVAFAALGVAGLALSDHPQSESWIASAVEWALLFFEHGVSEAGMTREGLGYCGFVFRNLSPFLLGVRSRGVFDYCDSAQNPFVERLARIPSWYAGEVFPQGGWVQNLNDSYWDPNPTLGGFLPAFVALDRDLTTQFWQRTVGELGQRSYGADRSLRWSTLFEATLWGPLGVELRAPEDISIERATEEDRVPSVSASGKADGAGTELGESFHCPDVGYLRAWTPDRESGFSFNCGKYVGSIHDQSDNNSFTLFAAGVPFVIDAGAANAAEEGSVSSSYGHSAVLIDGLGQAPTGGGLGVSGYLEQPAREATRTTIAGDAVDSYAQRGYNTVRRARRWCVFDHRQTPHLVVFDDIQKDERSHSYEFLFHTPTPTESLVEGHRVRLKIELQGVMAVGEIVVLNPEEVTISSEAFTSPGQPPFEQHTLWRVATQATNPEFVILFIAGSEAVPAYEASAVLAEGRVRVMVELEGNPSNPILLPRQGR